jgi:serine/threonine protein kinase
MTLSSGTFLGPQQILGSIGAGGMGEVYRARDTRLNRIVAIKVLPEESSNPALRQRFEREAQTIAALNHPHICSLYDVGHQDGIDFLVLEERRQRRLCIDSIKKEAANERFVQKKASRCVRP